MEIADGMKDIHLHVFIIRARTTATVLGFHIGAWERHGMDASNS